MLNVQFPRHGAILNHNHGKEDDNGLTIEVRGVASVGNRVTINGIEAERKGRAFSGKVTLTQKFNDIVVQGSGSFGDEQAKITVLWDKKSFPRSNFYIDDHSFFLTDIAHDRPKSLFDHFYLKGLSETHKRYGTKFTLNCFYRNDHHPFTLPEFPDIYKSEWKDNSDWLKLSFHAFSEFPDRCYEAPGSSTQLLKDFDLVKGEIERFAGPDTFIQPPVVHWAVCSWDCVKALAKNGMRVFSAGWRGVGPACDAAIAKGLDPTIADLGIDLSEVADIGYGMSKEEAVYLYCYRTLYNFDAGCCFVRGAGCLCNGYTPEQILANFEQSFNMKFGNECYGLGSHEQYTFPYYKNYIPDHLLRIDTAARTAYEHGCKPVYYQQAFLGNDAWDE